MGTNGLLRTDAQKNRLIRLLSFLLPCLMTAVCFFSARFLPFGSLSALNGDAGAQYYPFLMLLRRAVRDGESLLYTWRAGFGTNLWALSAYYCISIFNLPALLLPESAVMTWLTFSVCLRIGAAGWSTAVLLQTVRRTPEETTPVFAMVYSFSAWFTASFFQLIWLDAAALAPLILAGVVRLVRDRDGRLYTAMLALSLLSNPYFTFFACCMAGVCWLALLVIRKKPLNSLLRETGRFLGCSLLAAGISAVLLIPMALTVLSTDAAGSDAMPALNSFHGSLTALLARLAPFGYPVQHLGMANIACSLTAVFACCGYFTSRAVPKRERAVMGAVFAFVLLSLLYAPLEYLWNGGHLPHGYLHRSAYLLPLVMAFMGWRMLSAEHAHPEMQSKLFKRLLRTAVMIAGAVGVVLCAALHHENDVMLLCASAAVLTAAVWILRAFRPAERGGFAVLLTLLTAGEMTLSGFFAIGFISSNYRASELMPDSDAAALLTEHIPPEHNGFARTAVYADRGFNQELLYDIRHGGSSYSSLVPAGLTGFCERLGYDCFAGSNYYFYDALMPMSALLTDTQYVLAADGKTLPAAYDTLLGQTGEGESRTALYASVTPDYAGFCVPADCADALPDGEGTVFQNSLFSSLTGVRSPYLAQIPHEKMQADYCEADFKPDGSFTVTGGETQHSRICLTYQTVTDGLYYYELMPDSALASGLKTLTVTADGETLLEGRNVGMLHDLISGKPAEIGSLSAGQTVVIELTADTGCSGTGSLTFSCYDEQTFTRGCQALGAHALHLTALTDTGLTGTVDVPENSVLYLSVPYESGWHAEADGVPADIYPVFGAMCGIRLSPGTHTVTLRFFPPGLSAGIAVTACSLLLAAVLAYRFRKQRKTEAAACEPSK